MTVRVYLASTLPRLAEALVAGAVRPPPLPGFAVTPLLREAYASGDLEELEYAALTDAARASLRLLAADAAAPPRRVVLAADVPSELVVPTPEVDPAAVRVDAEVPLRWLASGHVDDDVAEADVADAARAVPAADRGDADARFAVDGAEGHELLWFATQELPGLVAR